MKNSIGREYAIQLAQNGWWKDKTPQEIVKFQLFTKELSMPFKVFYEALEKSLGRPVYTHEIGLDYDGLVKEFLGERSAPSIEDILELIPEDKRMAIIVGGWS